MTDGLNSLFYTYNKDLYLEHEDCRYSSIEEWADCIATDFYNNIYSEGFEFLNSVKYADEIIRDYIILELLNRLKIYIKVEDGNVLKERIKEIKVPYNGDAMDGMHEHLLLRYVDIIKFNKDYYGI